MPPLPPRAASNGEPRTATILLAVAVGVLLWITGQVLLLVFAGILLAVGLDGLAAGLAHRTLLTRGWALAVIVLLLAAGLALLGWAVLPQLMGQLNELWKRLSEFYAQVRDLLGQYDLLKNLLAEEGDGGLAEKAGAVAGQLASATLAALGLLGAVVILLAIAMFAVADPELYRRGFLALAPAARRRRIAAVLGTAAHALRWWFLGQLVSMLVLGVTVSLGLWAAGIELWLGLGVLTALLTFVPFLGPIIAGIPIVIVAFATGVETGLIVLAFYIVVQNLEGNILTPIIQHRVVKLPPALLIASQVLMGVLFGPMGFILAAPLTVVAMIAIRMLYIEDVLGEKAGPAGADS